MKQDLKRWIDTHREMYGTTSGPFPMFYNLLSTKGSWYETENDWTGGYPQLEQKECFSNAIHMALEHKWLYAEGLAVMSDLGIPMHHAWCIDPAGNVIDPTWRCRSKNVTWLGCGLVFEPTKVIKQFLKQKYYGLVADHYNEKNAKSFTQFLDKEYSKAA